MEESEGKLEEKIKFLFIFFRQMFQNPWWGRTFTEILDKKVEYFYSVGLCALQLIESERLVFGTPPMEYS